MTKKMMPYIKFTGFVVALLIAACRIVLEGMYYILKDIYVWAMDKRVNVKYVDLFADRVLALAHIFGQDPATDIKIVLNVAFGLGTAATLAKF